MSNKALTALPLAGTLTGTELLYMVQAGDSRKIALSTITTFIKQIEVQDDGFVVGQATGINFVGGNITFAGGTAAVDLTESAQDAIGGILAVTGDINVVYDDATPALTFSLNPLSIVTISTTTHTIATTARLTHYRYTNASGCTVIIPTNAADPIPIGRRYRMTAAGAGAVVLVPQDGTVTLRSRANALTSAGQYAVFEVEKVGTNEWDILGDVTV